MHFTHDALPLPDQIGLVLQGGGALGSYQGGVYEALAAAGIQIDRIAGISIGAVNAALIAGNPPEKRCDALRAFWGRASTVLPDFPIWYDARVREWVHDFAAATVAVNGVPGMFWPRPFSPLFAPPGTPEALSFYDTTPLRETLDRLVDWDLLNNGPIRMAVGAVEVETGNFTYFDTAHTRIDARHVMASGALPPGLPPVEIDGKHWWDGGLVSNTPLSWMLETQDAEMLVFQVDLFASTAPMPRTMTEVMAREKEIRFSSRTRAVSNSRLLQRAHGQLVQKVIDKLPASMADDPDVRALTAITRHDPLSVIQLIYRPHAWETHARDYEFSARTMKEHWRAGRAAVAASIERSAIVAQNILDGGTAAFDLGKQ